MGIKPRVAVMCCDGLYQRFLMKRLADEFELVGILIHTSSNAKGTLTLRLKKYVSLTTLGKYLLARILMPIYEAKAKPLVTKLFYERGTPPQIPADIPILHGKDVNEPEAVDFMHRLSPDIICVNGTNLLRTPMLNLIPKIRYGIINLHTGLSPYSRGGNCNLYMLLESHPELVGLTIHHINAGIDSGDIIISARPTMSSEDNYDMIDAKVFRLGIDLMIIAVRQLVENRAQRVKQWENGKLFLKKTGYTYNPYQRVEVNRLLKKGLISDYLSRRYIIDRNVKTIGSHL